MPSKKGASKAEPKPESQPESQEEKAVEVQKEDPKENVEETKVPEAAASKRGRGRPKKDGSAEPTTKKTKKVKGRSEPSRTSQRVANMKTGMTEPEPTREEEPTKKKVTKKAQPTVQEEKELSASNGATQQAVVS